MVLSGIRQRVEWGPGDAAQRRAPGRRTPEDGRRLGRRLLQRQTLAAVFTSAAGK